MARLTDQSPNRTRRRVSNRGLLAGGAVAAAVIALALYLGGVFNSGRSRLTAPVFGEVVRRELAESRLSGLARGKGRSPTSSRRVGSRPSDSPVLAALNNYWADIERHQFAAAFGYYAPGGTDLTEAEFVSDMQRSGVKSVTFSGTVTASTKSLVRLERSFATVAVTSLVTHDDQHGCRKWSGSYTMLLEETGHWHIQRAGLSARPC